MQLKPYTSSYFRLWQGLMMTLAAVPPVSPAWAMVLANRAKKKAVGDDLVLKRLAYFEQGLEVAEIWCRAYQDQQGEQLSRSLVLARREKAGFQQLDELVKATGFPYNRREHSIKKALRNTDRIITEIEARP